MEKIIFSASCPICGRTLFKGSPSSYMELSCPKCKAYLSVNVENDGVRIHLKETQNRI